jgi:hypothetical protein
MYGTGVPYYYATYVNIVYVDIDRYYLNRVDEIVGIILHILAQYKKYICIKPEHKPYHRYVC